MSDTLPNPLWTTPLRDLVRGRLTGRLDWRGRLGRAPLTPPLREAVVRVVRRTRLWKLEKAAVADELIAHFADGLAAGASADTLLSDFGDERATAKLIRRAKRRNRPLAWHLWKYAVRGAAAVVLLYGVMILPFLLRRPVVSVDYVAKLNAPLDRVPEADRAWPVYRRAMLALDLTEQSGRDDNHPLFQSLDDLGNDRGDGPGKDSGRDLVDATLADAAWPQLVAWLDAHQAGVTVLQEATRKPVYGFVLGRGGSAYDPELGWSFGHDANGSASTGGGEPLIGVLLPALNRQRQLAMILAADARRAAARGDGSRVVNDLVAVFDLAAQRDCPVVVSGLVGIGINAFGFEALERVLADTPGVLTDAQLVALAHRVARVGDDTPASLVDASGERMMFYDFVQRTYSDDGHGDGRMTVRGAAQLPQWMGMGSANGPDAPVATALRLSIAGVSSLLATRREVVAEYDRLMALQDEQLARPQRLVAGPDAPGERARRRVLEIQNSPVLAMRFLPIAIMAPASGNAARQAERVLGRREGVTVGLALELYRRRHGAYPAALADLVPTLLPNVPADRIDGRTVRYRVDAGRPVVYSVGVDRDDDRGRAPPAKDGTPQSFFAAVWPSADDPLPVADGDWVLFDARPAPAPATRPAGGD